MVKISPNFDDGLSSAQENFSPRFFHAKRFGRSVALDLASLSAKSWVDLTLGTPLFRVFADECCLVHPIRILLMSLNLL